MRNKGQAFIGKIVEKSKNYEKKKNFLENK